jgi:hypothetical protein
LPKERRLSNRNGLATGTVPYIQSFLSAGSRNVGFELRNSGGAFGTLRLMGKQHLDVPNFAFALCVAAWPFSRFHRYVAQGILPGDWARGRKRIILYATILNWR